MTHHTDNHGDDLALAAAVGVVGPRSATGDDVPAPRPADDDKVAAARAIALALGVEQGTDVRVPGTFDTVFVVVGLSRTAGTYNALVTRDEHSAWVNAADLVRGGQGARVDSLPLL